MLAKKWVRWPDPEDDYRAELFSCLGIAEVYCDTHDEENGWEELHALLRLVPPGSVAYGIPSGATLAAYPDGTIRALGGTVHCFKRKGRIVVPVKGLTP